MVSELLDIIECVETVLDGVCLCNRKDDQQGTDFFVVDTFGSFRYFVLFLSLIFVKAFFLYISFWKYQLNVFLQNTKKRLFR